MYFSRDRSELDPDSESELEELDEDSDDYEELLLLDSDSLSFLLLLFDFFLCLRLHNCYLRYLESSDSDLYLLLLPFSFKNLGHSFFLLVMLVLPVTKFPAIPTFVVRLRSFAFPRFPCYLYLQGPTLEI